MNSPTALVTGGAGFIGGHLVDRLVARGYYVRVFDNLSTGNLDNIRSHLGSGCVEFVKGTVCHAKKVEKVVEGMDFVFHLAAKTSVPLSFKNPSRTFSVNVSGTVNLLRCCHHARVKKFVFASSCAVYGDPYEVPVSEVEPADPISPYAESKMAGELFCKGFYKTGLLKTVMPRFFNVYGPRAILNDYAGVIVKFVENAKSGRPLIIYGDGSQTRDFVSVFDVVDALVLCVEDERADGEIFNIGSGKETTIEDLAETIIELSNSKSKILHKAERKGDIKKTYADISKVKQVLGFVPRVDLQLGLRSLMMGVGLS